MTSGSKLTAARGGERGFTVPEMLVSMVLLVTIGLATLGTVRFFIHALDARSTSQGGAVALEGRIDALRNDAATAFAVFVPRKDVFGNANLPPGITPGDAASNVIGHEVDFYGKTDTGAETYWAYRFDAAKRTLQRYDYDGAGNVGVADRVTGAIDTAGRYPALTGVKAFSAQRLHASDLTSGANVFGGLVAQLVAPGRPPEADPVGFIPASGLPRDDLYGGNVTMQLQIDTDSGARTLHLATATLPSGFTIHAAPAIRAFVYRINTVHRSWFGFAQKTRAHVYEQLQYSYHPNTDPPGAWHVWCDFELYGSHIAGLSLNDPSVVYHPSNYLESAAGVFYYVTSGAFKNLNPNCTGQQLPSPSQTFAPVPRATDPDVVETPPPCLGSGTCWPQNAPPNWTPPSPWPAATPPPTWCATHMQSGLCGGPGGTPVPITGSPPPVVLQTSAPAAAPPPML